MAVNDYAEGWEGFRGSFINDCRKCNDHSQDFVEGEQVTEEERPMSLAAKANSGDVLAKLRQRQACDEMLQLAGLRR